MQENSPTVDLTSTFGVEIQPESPTIGEAIGAGLSTALPRMASGLVRFPVAGTARQLADIGTPGMDYVAKKATAFSDYMDDVAAAEEAKKHPDFKVSFTEAMAKRPDLLFNSAWWTEELVEAGTSFGVPILAGLATAAITRNPVAATRAAIMTAAPLEASPVYNKVLKTTGDPDEAMRAGAMMFAGVTALSYLPTEALFNRLASKGLLRRLPYMTAVATGESISEALEEPLEAAITGDNVRDTVDQMINVMPSTFILSFLTAGVFSGVTNGNTSLEATTATPAEGTAESIQKKIDIVQRVSKNKDFLFNIGIAQQALNAGVATGNQNAINRANVIIENVAKRIDMNPEERVAFVEDAVNQIESVADTVVKEHKNTTDIVNQILQTETPVAPKQEEVEQKMVEAQPAQVQSQVQESQQPMMQEPVEEEQTSLPEFASTTALTISQFKDDLNARDVKLDKNQMKTLKEVDMFVSKINKIAKQVTNIKLQGQLQDTSSQLERGFTDSVREGKIYGIDNRSKRIITDIERDVELYKTDKKVLAQKVQKFKERVKGKEKALGALMSDEQFANKSATHAAFLSFWRESEDAGLANSDHTELLKGIVYNINLHPYQGTQLAIKDIDQTYEDKFSAEALQSIKRIHFDSIEAKHFDKQDKAVNRAIYTKTFLHELGHIWKNHIATSAQRARVDAAFLSLGKDNAVKYLKDAGYDDVLADYFTSHPDEFLSESFAIYQLNQVSPSKEFTSIFNRIVQLIQEIHRHIFSMREAPSKEYQKIYEEIFGQIKKSKPQTQQTEIKTKVEKVKEVEKVEDDEYDDEYDLDADESVEPDQKDFTTVEDVQLELDAAKEALLEQKEGTIDYKINAMEVNTLEQKLRLMKRDRGEPVDTSYGVNSAKSKINTRPRPDFTKALKTFREKLDNILVEFNPIQQAKELDMFPKKYKEVKFPGIKEGDFQHHVTTINDHMMFRNINGAQQYIDLVWEKMVMPKLHSDTAIAEIPAELEDAARQLNDMAEYAEKVAHIGPFTKAIMQSDGQVVMGGLETISQWIHELRKYIKTEESKAYDALTKAYQRAKKAMELHAVDTSEGWVHPDYKLRMSATDAKTAQMRFREWEEYANPERNPMLGQRLKTIWDLSRPQATMIPVTGEAMAYKEYKIMENGEIKATPTLFITEKMAKAIAKYKGPDIKQTLLKPTVYLFEQMDKLMPGIGFAKLVDHYQDSLAAHGQYTKRIIQHMKKMLDGVNTKELGIYAAVKDTPNMRGYLNAKGIKVDQIINRVVRNPKAMTAYAQGRQYFNEMWVDLNKSRQMLGLPAIPFRPDYFTFIKMNEYMANNNMDMLTATVHKIKGAFESTQQNIGNYHSDYAGFKFTERKPSPKPIDLEYGRVFQQYTQIASKHMHLSPVIMATRELTGPLYIASKDGASPKAFGLRDVGQDGMRNMKDQLTRWADYLAGNKNSREFGSNLPPTLDKAIGILANNIAVQTMGFAVRTFVIQPTANYLTALAIGPKYIYNNGFINWFKYAVKNDQEIARRLKLSNHLPTREVEAQISDIVQSLANMNPSNAWETMIYAGKKVQESSFKIIQLFDMWTAKIGWLGTFDYAKDRGMTDQEAAQIADRLIAKTHGTAAPGLRAPIQRTAYGRALTLFQTFQLNEFAFTVNEILRSNSITIPGQEQAQEKMAKLAEELQAQGVSKKQIDSHPRMMSMKKTLKDLGQLRTADDLKKERTRRILLYLFLGALINSFYEDLLGINSPLPAPIRAAWQAYANDDKALVIAAQPMLEIIKQVPIVGGGAYGGGMGGAGMDFLDDVTDVLSGKKGAHKSTTELMSKTFGVPLVNQINKSLRAADQGGSYLEIAVGMYPGHRRLMLDMITELASQ